MRKTYEGRELPRPTEEVVDQGLQFDIGTLLTRRRALGLLGIGAVGAGLTACGVTAAGSSPTPSASSSTSPSSTPSASATTGDLTEIPDETAGPYPGDGSNGPDVLETDGVIRSDIRSSFGGASGTAEGVPMTLELTILDMANGGRGMAGAAVYVWHCNREGEYSMYGKDVENENYLRGVQIADADGRVQFTSIFPACYSGRWPHIHFEVYPDEAAITDADKVIATSQVALPQATCEQVYATEGYEQSVKNLQQVSLTSDNVFGDDGGASQIAAVTGSIDQGFHVTLTAPVDTTTEPQVQQGPGGNGPGGNPPDGGNAPGGPGEPPQREN